jgi:hypothetical protein
MDVSKPPLFAGTINKATLIEKLDKFYFGLIMI